MAGAGGTGQQPKQQPDLYDMLAAEIAKSLGAEQPQAPAPPQQQPLSPASAFAAARNPQFAPMLNQQAQAPEQARYASQQAAFEAAMSGRQNAMQAGVGLVRSQPDGLDRARLDELIRHNQAMENKPPNMAFLSTPEGFVAANRRTAEVSQPLRRPDGSIAYPQPPAGVVSDISAGTANLQGLDNLRAAYQRIRSETQNDWNATKVVGTIAGETRLGGMLAPKYAEYTAARRASLNAYIKSVTGAQFSVAELQRYEGQYPEPWDDEVLAEQKIETLKQRSVADMQAKMRAFPAASGAAPQQTESIVDRAMRLAAEARAKAGGQ